MLTVQGSAEKCRAVLGRALTFRTSTHPWVRVVKPETGAMAFGRQACPPASARQVQQLLGLLQAAGHDGFRDARGPMGFTQRQAAGKFTRDEAAAFRGARGGRPRRIARPVTTPMRLSP